MISRLSIKDVFLSLVGFRPSNIFVQHGQQQENCGVPHPQLLLPKPYNQFNLTQTFLLKKKTRFYFQSLHWPFLVSTPYVVVVLNWRNCLSAIFGGKQETGWVRRHDCSLQCCCSDYPGRCSAAVSPVKLSTEFCGRCENSRNFVEEGSSGDPLQILWKRSWSFVGTFKGRMTAMFWC